MLFPVGVDWSTLTIERRPAAPPAHTLPPGDVRVQPTSKLVFNAPFDEKITYKIRVTNTGERKVACAAQASNATRLAVEPAGLLLSAGESAAISIVCKPFEAPAAAPSPDTVTVEWVNAPAEAPARFQRDALFPAGAATRQAQISIEYNV